MANAGSVSDPITLLMALQIGSRPIKLNGQFSSEGISLKYLGTGSHVLKQLLQAEKRGRVFGVQYKIRVFSTALVFFFSLLSTKTSH